MKKKEKEKEKGAMLLVSALIILTILVAIFVFTSASIVKEWKVFRDFQKSPQAYAAADSGAERVLYMLIKQNYSPPTVYPSNIFTWQIEDGSDPEIPYQVTVTVTIEAANTFDSFGEVENIHRAIELTY